MRGNGTVVAWSVSGAAELGRQPGPGPAFGMQRIPGGVITRSKDLFAWWAAGSQRPRITRQAPRPLHASEATLVSRELGVGWNLEPWTIASIWRLDDDGDPLWQGLIGRPRELPPFLEPQYMEAPHLAGGYYALAAVDYARDRFALAHNGMEGIVFANRDGPSSRLTYLPYARYQERNALLADSPYYVEASRRSVHVWDLDTDQQVARAELPEDTADVQIDPHSWAAWTIDHSGQVRRFGLPALTDTFRTRLSLIGEQPALLSTDARDRIAVIDEHLNLYTVDAARDVASGPVGLSSPTVDCFFSPDGRRVLVAQRNGDILILDLPD